jgi:hypothetical protein
MGVAKTPPRLLGVVSTTPILLFGCGQTHPKGHGGGSATPSYFSLIFKFINFLIENMTRGKGIIEIFRQNESFWYSLMVCGAQMMHLIV